jgi:predicted nuclease of predicted toxin-antitoxin system
MNLSPLWVGTFVDAGFEAVHWSAVGSPNAPDEVIMRYAVQNGFVVFQRPGFRRAAGLIATSQAQRGSGAD